MHVFAEVLPRVAARQAVRVQRATSVLVSHGDWQCERHCFGLSGDDLVVGVDQLNPNLVLPDRQTRDVDRVVITGVRPPPNRDKFFSERFFLLRPTVAKFE